MASAYADDKLCQMNVRIRTSQLEAVDARRNQLGLSRDEWVRRLLDWALTQPAPARSIRNEAGRTVKP